MVAGSSPVARPILIKFNKMQGEIKQKVLTSVLGLFLVIVSCFLIISFISYTPVDVYSPSEKITFNQGGKIGSGIANFFLQYFGLASTVAPLLLLTWGLILFYNNHLSKVSLKIILAVLSIILSAFLLGSVHDMENVFSFLIGGYCGWMLNSIFENSIFYLPIRILLLTTTPVVIVLASGVQEFCIPKKIRNIIPNIIHKFKYIRINEEIKTEDKPQNTIQTEGILPQKKRRYETPSIAKTSTPPKQTGKYYPPEVAFLTKNSNDNHKKHEANTKHAQIVQSKLKQVLLDFGVEGEIISHSVGPVITMYEFEPKAGIRSSRVIGLADDIARSLKASSARISIIPNKSSLAIEIPNYEREIVYLRELLEAEGFHDSKHTLPLCLGKDISGKSIVVDLAKMPHLLVAGTTGSGKSIGINSMIMSILYKLSPDECKLIMIDPKMLELSVYEGIPHLMTPVVTDPEKAALTLQWVTKEMENRYKAMSKIGVRNIFNYNSFIEENRDKNTMDAQYTEGVKGNGHEGGKMPYIVVIVDEMADLMLTAGKTVEASIQRLAQMARAAGIHIIMATQRPSVDVITGIIKANFPTRISFQVTSKIDSRTILGYQGAEALLGKGDMLYMPTGSKTYRVHGPFVDDKEVAKVVTYLKQNYPNNDPNYGKIMSKITADSDDENDGEEGGDGDLYSQAVAIVKAEKRASISYVQRRLRIGYNKAANFIEQMEDEGIVSAPDSQGKRIVIDGK
ncbi:MAG: DNA translocase FtsK 4TM domain-containing protein [Proteobacteria bacterium]|nr:DNA translocase FtsK 4TM domain-containing protein [Pseudomonadota bacterium]